MDQNLGANIADVYALSKQGAYDYIIVGSGMGGGVLARTLIECKKSVLLIERGKLLFTTHCLNTSRPHWNHNITEGASQDNDLVFNRVKQPVHTTYESYPYVGGPVHCLGGRSNVWGLYAPQIKEDILKEYFARNIVNYLTGKNDRGVRQGVSGYDKAYRLMCNDPKATMDDPYPLNIVSKKVENSIYETCKMLKKFSKVDFACGPVGAQFTPSDNENGLYRIPQGAFSTVDWLLDRIYKKDELLTVLLNTEVMAITANSTGEKSVSSLTVRQSSSDQQVEILTSKAQATVLCAGSIDTAVIALRSGLQGGREKSKTSVVGKGLNDHSIWGSRFHVLLKEDSRPHMPLKLEGWWANTGVLVNVVVNANTYLGSHWFPCSHYDSSGTKLRREDFEKACPPSGQKNTVQVTFEFTAPLEDANVVLNAPESVPVIRISSEQDESSIRNKMEGFVYDVKTALMILFRADDPIESQVAENPKEPQVAENPKESQVAEDPEEPQVAKGGFGVVAHEAGTMRMSKDPKKSVVDDDLKVHEWKDLYVCDMSIFPASPAANPSLTLVALAQRLGAHLAAKPSKMGINGGRANYNTGSGFEHN